MKTHVNTSTVVDPKYFLDPNPTLSFIISEPETGSDLDPACFLETLLVHNFTVTFPGRVSAYPLQKIKEHFHLNVTNPTLFFS